jgi:hypothetical protein
MTYDRTRLTSEDALNLIRIHGSIRKASKTTGITFYKLQRAAAEAARKPGEYRVTDEGVLAPDPIEQEEAPIEERLRVMLDERAPLPPVPAKIQAIRQEDMGFDTPQEAIVLFSDYHYGSRIDKRVSAGLAEYNIDIARDRAVRWRDGVLRFTQQDQFLLTVDTLHIFALGDDMEGHGMMFGSQGLQMDESLGFQVVGFVDDISAILPTFLARYKKIIVYKVHGNHGRIAKSAKEAYPPDNAELFAWQMIAERITGAYGGTVSTTDTGVRAYTGGPIEFYISPSFIMFLDILGFTFAIRHGHGIKGLQATYTGAIANKLRLNAIVGEVLNYYIKAHLHEAQSAENEIRGEIIQNGCFVGPSLLSVEMSQAAANLPSQEMFLMHPRKGITNRHRITLAEVDEVRQLEFIGR